MTIPYGLMLVLCYAVFSLLFYRQTVEYHDGYFSDTILYVNMTREQHGVRLITWIFHWLYTVGNGTLLIALYMGLVIIGIILMNRYLFNHYLRDDGLGDTLGIAELVSVIMLFTGSIYVPVIHEHFYKSSWCTFPWHSPTQHLMMLFGLISVALFLNLYQDYMNKIKPQQWIGLLVCGVVSVWAKPSFMLIFIPTMVVVFIIELAVHRNQIGRRLLRLVIIGISLVPSGILILLLNSSIYGEGSENKVSAGAGHILEVGYNIPIAAVCGLLFPLIVCMANFKRFKDLKYQIALGMLITGIVEWIVFFEEGMRATHGNFAWGRQAGCYFIFLISAILLFENYKDKSFMCEKKSLRKIYLFIAVCALCLAILTQAYHFYAMLRGHTYNF